MDTKLGQVTIERIEDGGIDLYRTSHVALDDENGKIIKSVLEAYKESDARVGDCILSLFLYKYQCGRLVNDGAPIKLKDFDGDGTIGGLFRTKSRDIFLIQGRKKWFLVKMGKNRSVGLLESLSYKFPIINERIGPSLSRDNSLFVSSYLYDIVEKPCIQTFSISDEIMELCQDSLLIKDNVGNLVSITASCILPNEDVLIGGVRGDICQIRLDADGKLLKNNFIGYLHNRAGATVPVDHIIAMPGSNNYLIGSKQGALYLAEFAKDEIVIVDKLDDWPIILADRRFSDLQKFGYVLSHGISSIKPLSDNIAVIIAENRRDCQYRDERYQYPCYIKVSDNKIFLHQMDWFHSSGNDGVSNISTSLLLPSNQLLLGGMDGCFFLVWGENGDLKHQNFFLDIMPPEKISYTVTETWCEEETEAEGEHYRSKPSTWSVRRYSVEKTKDHQIDARLHRFVGGLLILERDENSCKVLVQRSHLISGSREGIPNFADGISGETSGNGYRIRRANFESGDAEAYTHRGNHFSANLDSLRVPPENYILTVNY